MHNLGDLLEWAGLGFEAIGIAIVPSVVLRRKEPSSTIAWILTLLFLPALGALLYALFGRDRIRWPAKRKRQADALVRSQVAAAQRDVGTLPPTSPSGPAGAPVGVTCATEPLDALEQQIFQVSALLAGGGVSTGNRVQILSRGNDAFTALGDAIDMARHHVHAEYYLIRNDATGTWFSDRLIAAAKRGVEVRLLCDGYGCFGVGRIFRARLRRAGAKFGLFLPMRSVLFQPMNLRNHRKIVVVDGHVAFSGGLNIGDEYRDGAIAHLGRWRDTHYRVEGPSAQALQRVFLQDWYFATGEALDPAPYFPRLVSTAGQATVGIVPSGPDTRTEAIHRLFFAAIAGARERVWITTPYFVPDPCIVLALQVAAMRGVDVRLILPGRSNHKVTFHAGRSFYEELLEAGVRIHEYLPGMIHAKTLVTDGKIVLVGSANMDMRSFRLNFEVHALIHDSSAAAELEARFADDLRQTRAVEHDLWQRRPLAWRAVEGSARFVSPLL